MIEQSKCTYSPLGNSFKQIKTFEDKGKNQVAVLKDLKPDTQKLSIKDEIPEDKLNEEAKNEIENIIKNKKG